MTTEEQIKVMQAYVDGKQIQILTNQLGWKDEVVREWMDTKEEPSWDWENEEYRIKPEPKKPTYRPYKDTDEMIADFEERFRVNYPTYAMPMIWLKYESKYSKVNEYHLVTYYSDNSECALGETMYEIGKLFDEFTYLDGSPVGKLVE